MYRHVLHPALLLLCATLFGGYFGEASGQAVKPTVAILPVSTTASDAADRYAARGFEGLLAQAMTGIGRVVVLDRTQDSNVQSERQTQMSVDFIDSRVLAAQGQSLGAQLVVTGNVDKLAMTANRLNDGSVDYQANLTLSLRVIDVTTQEVHHSEVISANAASGGRGGIGGLLRSAITVHNTPEDAIAAAVKNTSRELDEFLAAAFPARFTIVQVEEISQDSSRASFLIDGGRNIGARVKLVLTVIEPTQVQVGARAVTREVELGTIEITKLEGDELSVGAMRNGSREVARRLAAGGTVHAILR